VEAWKVVARRVMGVFVARTLCRRKHHGGGSVSPRADVTIKTTQKTEFPASPRIGIHQPLRASQSPQDLEDDPVIDAWRPANSL
jgi:hypothetical protein